MKSGETEGVPGAADVRSRAHANSQCPEMV